MRSRTNDSRNFDRRTVVFGALGVLVAGCLGDDDTGEDMIFAVGEIEIMIDGEPVDLSADRFQAEYADDHAIEFHLHEFDDHWYMEGAEPVTVGEGIDLLPEISFALDADSPELIIDDVAYDAQEDGVTIDVFVNENEVDPETYVLEDGDEILVEVNTESP